MKIKRGYFTSFGIFVFFACRCLHIDKDVKVWVEAKRKRCGGEEGDGWVRGRFRIGD